jgi:hypothetical protein
LPLRFSSLWDSLVLVGLLFMETEIWKDVIGFEGYQISNLGNVRGLDRIIKGRWKDTFYKGKMLSPSKSPNGYYIVSLCKNGKQYYFSVHRLVYEHFIGNTDIQIDHIDNVKSNNRLDNLQALSARDNSAKAKALKYKTSTYTGVHKLKNGKWKSQIGINNKKYSLGTFINEIDAHNAYIKAKP